MLSHDLARAALESAVSVVLIFGALIAQANEFPAASWVTAGAGFVGLIAVGNMVRAIGRTEAQKTELIEALQEQLRQAHDEIRELYELNRTLRDQHDL